MDYDGTELIYPNFRDRHGLDQTAGNSRYLADFLQRETGRRLPVTGILALPGWYVTTSGHGPILVRNHKSVAKTIQAHQAQPDPESLRRATEAVRKLCCDVVV